TPVPGLSIDPTQGTVRWRPTPDQIGPHDVTFRVRDTYGGAAIQSFTIVVRGVDQPPEITSTPAVTVALGAAYAYPVGAVDADTAAIIFRVAVTPPAGVATPTFTFDSANVLRWSSATPAGNYIVAVTADDQQGGTDTQTYTLVVGGAAANRPPSIT